DFHAAPTGPALRSASPRVRGRAAAAPRRTPPLLTTSAALLAPLDPRRVSTRGGRDDRPSAAPIRPSRPPAPTDLPGRRARRAACGRRFVARARVRGSRAPVRYPVVDRRQ